MNWQHFGQKQIISFTAPTGAGKTIMMASFVEAMMCGDDEGLVAPIPESIFIWLSDSPGLNEQSRRKMELYCNKLVISQFHTLDEDFRGDKLLPQNIYFLNTQKLLKDGKMSTVGDGHDYTIWEVIENTIEEYGKHLVLIIDEAHRGAKTNQTTIMQKFVNGYNAKDPHLRLQALPMIIGMSATPERFNTLAGASQSTVSKVIVEPAEVRSSGLLKDVIEIHYPEPSVIGKNMAVLQAAADEWKDKCLHWYNYTEKQHYQNVCPIFVVQVEPAAGGKKVSATDLDECLRVIEQRTGERFKTGEVVHAFPDQGTLNIHGLDVAYCQPTDINDDRDIKVVLFKEALSTGWDCPRAETMMSFRVARDATYIAQLLGRMIRTPLRMRVDVDESLNYVHLFLPNFDEATVDSIVSRLTEEEGGTLPTDVHAIQGGNRQTVVMSAKRPVQQHRVNSTSDTQQQASATSSPQVEPSSQHIPTILSHVSHREPFEAGQQQNRVIQSEIELTPEDPQGEQSQSVVDPYEEVKEAINQAEILTYEVKTVATNKNYMRALFDMARLAVMSGMDPTRTAIDNVKDAFVEQIHQYIEEVKQQGRYQELVDRALSFQLNTISYELYKNGIDYARQEGPNLFSTTDAGLSQQYQKAEILLCGEGIGNRYEDKYGDESDDENACRYDVILYAADEHQQEKRMDFAKSEFQRLADLYRPKTKTLSDRDKQQYDSLVTQSDTITKHLFRLPETINVDLDRDGETCSDHLFVNEEGTATFNLKGWEPLTLKEERSHPDFVTWLRNQERKPWALCIPYEYGDETHRMYPDFLVVRKDDNGGFDYALLEPHRDDKKDNLAKAKGLVKYARECSVVSRVQMLRKRSTAGGEHMLRLDLTSLSVAEKVMKCNDDADFDVVFNEEGFFEFDRI